MNAAEDLSVGFHTVPENPAIAVRTDRSQRMDRAFEAIKCVMLSVYNDLERLVVFIFTNFACTHTLYFRA
jgi:hypothetical protein